MAKIPDFCVEVVRLYFVVTSDNWCRDFWTESSEAIKITWSSVNRDVNIFTFLEICTFPRFSYDMVQTKIEKRGW